MRTTIEGMRSLMQTAGTWSPTLEAEYTTLPDNEEDMSVFLAKIDRLHFQGHLASV